MLLRSRRHIIALIWGISLVISHQDNLIQSARLDFFFLSQIYSLITLFCGVSSLLPELLAHPCRSCNRDAMRERELARC